MQDKQPVKVLLTLIIMWQFAFGISNRAISVLVKFLHKFFKFLEKGDTLLCNLWEIYPKSLKGCQTVIDLKCTQFEQFVVCLSCNAIYHISNCPPTCIHKQYPNHPQVQFRKPCGTPLLIKRKGSIRAIKTNLCNQQLVPSLIVQIFWKSVNCGAPDAQVLTYYQIFMMETFGKNSTL